MYNNWSSRVTLADYSVLASIAAVKFGVEQETEECRRTGGPCEIKIKFVAGRRTCSNPDQGQEQGLPKGEDKESPHRILMGEFGCSEEEMVALMGE